MKESTIQNLLNFVEDTRREMPGYYQSIAEALMTSISLANDCDEAVRTSTVTGLSERYLIKDLYTIMEPLVMFRDLLEEISGLK